MGAEKSLYGGDEGWESDPEMFAQVAATPSQWSGQSGEHLYAAQILLPSVQQQFAFLTHFMGTGQTVSVPPQLVSIYFLHCAFSLENTFKSVIAASHADEIREEVRKTRKLPAFILGHDLLDLAGRADFQVGIDGEHTLVFLTRYGIWAGRYPMSVRNADYNMTEQLSDGKHYLVAGYRHDQVPDFVAFSGEVYAWAKEKVKPSVAPDPVSQQSPPP